MRSSSSQISAALFVLVLMLAAFAVLPQSSRAATACTFTSDLTIGSDSESVRCLQKYLNGAGFKVSASGVGSPGMETTQFQAKTQAAVKAWQAANGISPATGTFGPLSRSKYAALNGGASVILPAPAAPVVPPSQSSTAAITAKVAIRDAISAYQSAAADIDDADEDEREDAMDLAASARTALFNAVTAYLNENYTGATTYANNARSLANDAADEVGSNNDDDDDNNNGDEDDAQDALDDAEDAIDEAKDDIDQAYEDGDDTDDADDLIDEAEDLFEEAEEAFDDEDYDEVMDLTDEIQDLVDEALDEIDSTGSRDDEDDAEEAIDDVNDDLDAAWDEVDDAHEDGDDTDDAEDLLNDAQDKIDDAEDAFNDEDYDEVFDLLDEASDLIDEALDEL